MQLVEARVRLYEALPVAEAAQRKAKGGVRRNQANLDGPARDAFKGAITQMGEAYRCFLDIHARMDEHRMHGMSHEGLYRFLPWHRRFLLAFEDELSRAAGSPMTVPYWRWPDPFPDWMDEVWPSFVPAGAGKRTLAPSEFKPTDADITRILTRSEDSMPGASGINAFGRFSVALEGAWARPDGGGDYPGHNSVHAWIGGVMDKAAESPTDPMFWFVHSEVDRLWAIWQLTHPSAKPRLWGEDLTMDPWTDTYDDLHDITKLGYSYDSMEP